MKCKRDTTLDVLIAEWCIGCLESERNNIFKRYCELTRRLIKERENIGR